jgi:hypothetical protein
VVEAAAGNRGLTTLVDRTAGVIVAMSYWDDLRHSSEAALTKAREGAAKAAGGTLVAEGFEVAVAERLAVPGPGATVQMTRVQLDPVRVDAGLAFIRDELLQRLSACSGLCSAELLDRSGDRQRVVGDDVDRSRSRRSCPGPARQTPQGRRGSRGRDLSPVRVIHAGLAIRTSRLTHPPGRPFDHPGSPSGHKGVRRRWSSCARS